MASSGSFSKTFSGNSNYKIIVEWSATQSISENTSTITVKTYLSSGSSWSIYANGQSLTTYIDGSSAGSTVNLSSSGGKKILLNTRTKKVTHNADGTKSTKIRVKLSTSGVTISGKSLGTADTGDKSITLNTIPRKSSLTSAKSFTATNSYPCTVSRSSSSFIHKLKIKNGSTVLKTVTDISTSKTITFSQAENLEFLKLLKESSSINLTFELETWTSGYGKEIGSSSYTVKMNNPASSTLSTPETSYYIGAEIPITIKPYKSEFTHTIKYQMGSVSGTIVSNTSSATVNWNTGAIKDAFYQAMVDTSVGTVAISCETYLGGVKVNKTTTINRTLRIAEGHPTFPGDSVTYRDNNNTTVQLTGNNQYVIQNMSDVVVSLNKLATPHNGATIKSYSCQLGSNRVVSTNLSTQTFTLGKVNLTSNDYIFVTATDSRGLSTTISIPVNILPYNKPSITAKCERLAGFENDTNIISMVEFSPLMVNGVNKNEIVAVRYKTKVTGSGSWSGLNNTTITKLGDGIVKGSARPSLDNTLAYDIYIEAQDRVGGVVSVQSFIDKGYPLMFFDTDRKSLGFGGFPVSNNDAEFFMNATFNNPAFFNKETHHAGLSHFTGGIDVNGVDITKEKVRSNPDGYTIFMAGFPVGYIGSRVLWTGSARMDTTTILTMGTPLSKCPNGWCLIWSDFDQDTGKPNDFNWDITYIPRDYMSIIPTGGLCQRVATGHTNKDLQVEQVIKYVYITNTTIQGHADNLSGKMQNDVCLRAVLVW